MYKPHGFFSSLKVASSKRKAGDSITFLISRVSIHLSILRTVDISICSLEMELSQVVKLSTVARNRTQVNFRILNILLMILSRQKKHGTVKRAWSTTKGCAIVTLRYTNPSTGFCRMFLMWSGLLILRDWSSSTCAILYASMAEPSQTQVGFVTSVMTGLQTVPRGPRGLTGPLKISGRVRYICEL